MDELRILLLEDSPTDAELNELVLRKAGLAFSALRVESEPAFRQALDDFKPDVVLADYSLPSFNGRDAIEYVRRHCPGVPVIMVTGAVGEEMAAELLRAGASDYILKDRLIRLPDAVRRVLREQEAVEARRVTELRLREAENKFRTLFETANDGIFLQDATGFVDCNQKGAEMYGLTREGVIGHSPAEFCPERQADGRLSSEVAAEKMRDAMAGETQRFEWRALRYGKDGSDKTPLDVDINLNRIELGGAVYLQAIVRDIAERKQVEDALRASESRYRLLVENAPMCIHEIDMDGRIVSMNRAGLLMLGFKQESAVQGLPYLDAVCEADRERIADLLARAYGGESSHFEFKSGGSREQIFKSCFVPIVNGNGVVEKLMSITEDITERKLAEEQIHTFAFFDALTQLPNRRLLNDRLRQTMLASKRSGHYCALMFLDLDNFKPLNDTHGHDVGDLLLVEVARRLTRCVRGADTVARFGGDEFVVMLGDLNTDKAESFTQAGTVAEKIRNTLSEPYVLTFQQGDEVKTVTHHCTSSIGVVLFIDHETAMEEIIKSADRAMYHAKVGGRNTIRYFDPATGLSQPGVRDYD